MHCKAKAGFFALAALGLVVPSLPSCAQGNDPTTAEVSEANAAADAGPDAACPPCGAGTKCSAGACVSVDTDADRDGFPLSNDCNDHDPAVHPGAAEICNGADDNCDGKVDEGFDADGDGTPTCGIGSKPGDCDDKDPAVHPGAKEVCNGKDDDCNGVIDDGFYSCARGSIPLDCDDSDPKIHVGATEICNGKDDDCNGKIDEIPAALNGSLSPPVNAHWLLGGTASLVNGWAQLTTDNVTNQVGALWWNAQYTFDTFDVISTFWIQNKPEGADGLTFAWVPGSGNGVGGAAFGFGLGGLGGYGVAIDTFQNASEPAAPSLAVVTGANPPVVLARATIPNVRDALNHRLRVRVAAGKVSVWIDTINYLFEFGIPGYVPFKGRWGFTAATGGAAEAHWVADVAMSFPDGQGCVP